MKVPLTGRREQCTITAVGGGGCGSNNLNRPKDRTRVVNAQYEGIRYSIWSNEAASGSRIGNGWIDALFDQDLATVILSLTEVHSEQ